MSLPDGDYVMNHVVNRIPLVAQRLAAYAALGVSFDDVTDVNIALGGEVWNGAGLSVGRGSSIGQSCYVDARGGIRLSEQVSVGREVALITATHIVDDPSFDARVAPIELGTRSFIGVRALVLPGVTIGEGAVVGAAAVVTRDVEPWTVVTGIPAAPVGRRQGPMDYELRWRPNWY